MGLFDIFNADTSTPKRMYQAQNNATNQANTLLQSGQNAATNDYTTGTQQGIDYLTNAQGQAAGALGNANASQTGYLNTGLQQGQGYLNDAQGFYGATVPTWQTLSNIGTEGLNQYGNVAGLNGQEAATAAYQGSPGYQWELGQGLDALNRTANSRGMLTSGNNTQDILKYSQGLAGQDYFKYLNALQPYFGLAPQAAQGLSNAYGNMAGVATDRANLAQSAYNNLSNVAGQYGSNLSNLYTGTGANLANLKTALGSNLAGVDTATAAARAALATQSGQNKADMYGNIYNNQQAAGNNLWGALLGVAGLGTNLAGQIYKPTAVG